VISVPLNTSISSIGSIEVISREARHNNAFTGIPEELLLDVLDISSRVIPVSLLPVKNDPSLCFFVEGSCGSVEEQAVTNNTAINNKYLNMN
jgi:hypothetical protein